MGVTMPMNYSLYKKDKSGYRHGERGIYLLNIIHQQETPKTVPYPAGLVYIHSF